MSKIAYVNGRYLPHARARVHVEDRGYQFADGVYEVCAVLGGKLVDLEPHLDRLERSLGALRIPLPMSRRALAVVLRQVVRRNRVRDGLVYYQVTRGVAPRNHGFPDGVRPALVVTARNGLAPAAAGFGAGGVKVITCPDIRWARSDIKSIALLANVLAKQQAREAGAFEAWMVDREGFVTEGSSSNAWIVNARGDLVTRHADNAILNGITRRAVLDLAREEGIALVEQPFDVAEAEAAREAFLTSATSFVTPVVRVNDSVIGDGKAGPLGAKLMARYLEYAAGAGGDGVRP